MDRASPDRWDWTVAVFCQNEQDTIGRCLAAIAAASVGHRVLVCVLVNGSSDSSLDKAVEYARASPLDMLVVRIPAGDKSNAINVFNEVLRVPAQAYIYVDGYVNFTQGSFAALAAALDADRHANATTGICTTGRTMKLAAEHTLKVGGRLHGQMHALRPAFVDRMGARGIRLPVGLYRGDGLLGSMAAHDLDPMEKPWDNSRVRGVADAQYAIRSLSIFSPSDVLRQLRRMVRQARGRMENRAIKDIIDRLGYEGLPDSADVMIAEWLERTPLPRPALADLPFVTLARRAVRDARPIPPERLRPTIAYVTRPEILDSIRDPSGVA